MIPARVPHCGIEADQAFYLFCFEEVFIIILIILILIIITIIIIIIIVIIIIIYFPLILELFES